MNNLKSHNKLEGSLTPEELKIYRKALGHDCSKITSSKKYNWSCAVVSILFIILLIERYISTEDTSNFLRDNWITFGTCLFSFIINDINRRVFILYRIIQQFKDLSKDNKTE